jgi:hypothetical protein
MALIIITGEDGKPVLAHSSIFDAPQPRPARATGNWTETWERFDGVEPKPRAPLVSQPFREEQ